MLVALDYQTWFKWIISIKVVFFGWIFLELPNDFDFTWFNDQICWTTAVVQYQCGDEIMGDMLVIYLFGGGKSSTVWVYLWVYSTIPRFLLVGEEADFQLKGIMRIQANQQTTQVLNVPHFGIIPGWTPSQNSVDNNYSWEAYWNWGKTTIRLPIKLGKRILRFWISNVWLVISPVWGEHGELIINMFSLDILNTTYVVHRPPISAPFSPSFMEVYPHWRVQTYDKHGDGEMEHTWHYVRTSNLWMELKMITSIHYSNSDMDEFTGIAHHFVSSGDKWYLYYI